MSKFYVNYKCYSKKTGHVLSGGGIYVEASNQKEAEGIALGQLNQKPPVFSTEGVRIEVRA